MFEFPKSTVQITGSPIHPTPQGWACSFEHMINDEAYTSWEYTYCSHDMAAKHWIQIDLLAEYFVPQVKRTRVTQLQMFYFISFLFLPERSDFGGGLTSTETSWSTSSCASAAPPLRVTTGPPPSPRTPSAPTPPTAIRRRPSKSLVQCPCGAGT